MKRLFAFFAKWRAERATRRLLYGMSDRMLNDIGLRRDEIELIRFS